jgi:uncharacterized protein (UPF0332 family)
MSKLRAKADFNFQAAQILIDNDLYAPSIHCSYYSCFQLLKHSVYHFFGVDYETLGRQVAADTSSTHNYLIRYVSEQIRNNMGREAYREFNNKIKDLKNFREESDYDNVEINIDKGLQAHSLARELRSFMQNNLHV